ncbi:rhomboid family intramembrane serine protease [Solitalea lacus]|uniref:rhomboid family intramembrane serine protease n=1 Tax=Solitalea lacus TaxID=2911172 RepID=UPI001EDC8EBE|nr:rhomboid family intramembrane serine protease [Solitalea lacus]UKJ06666.1 rhomboid family intramembrane serine protease [Solitalea lacus]
METTQTGSIIKSFIIGFYLVLLLWIVKWIEFKFDISFAHWGIYPRSINGLKGILTAPFIHADINHLASNSLSLLITATMLWYFFKELAIKTIFSIYLLTGLGVWLFARPAIHIGASGVVYGLTSFLFFSGLFRKDPRLMGLSLLVVFLYGSLIWGIFPISPELSWESHLTGGVIGALLGYFFRNQGPQRKTYAIENEDEEEEFDDEYWNEENKDDEESKPDSLLH